MKNLILPFLLSVFSLQAQQKDNFNFELKAAIEKMDSSEELHLYIHGDLPEISSFTRTNGGVLKGVVGDVASVRIPVGNIHALQRAEFVEYIEFTLAKPEMLADQMIVNNNIHPIHSGANPLPQSYLGDDVILGIVDSGIELDHPDFQFEDGTTRVLSLWDHRQSEDDPFRVPEPYGYGQEWNSEDIDMDIDGHQATFFGHGSNVAGIAAGNANATGELVGVAPNADLIIVQTNFDLPNWTSTVADAIEFIFEKADELGKPAVVNLSLGTYGGSKDGLDAASLRINQLVQEQPGRVVVSAAGNSHSWDPWHLSYDVPESDTAFTWITYNANSLIGEPAAFIELWADSADFYNTQYTIGADLSVPSFSFERYADWRNVEQNLGTIMVDTILNGSTILAIVETWCGQRGGQYNVQIVVKNVFFIEDGEDIIYPYKWRFATTGGGSFDIWARENFGTSTLESENLPPVSEYSEMEKYKLPDNLKSIVGSWNCSDHVISVANYTNRNTWVNFLGETVTVDDVVGEIATSSSQGPTRDNRQKPDIAATGSRTFAAGDLGYLQDLLDAGNDDNVYEGGWHYINGGTSMASPVVAGVSALYLQRDPDATHQEIKDAIIENAIADQFTGALPGLRWGYGKLNGFATLTEPFGVTSTEFVAINGEISIYPNPSNGEITILNDQSNLVSFDLYDLSGRLVESVNLRGFSGGNVNLSLNGVADGIYVVQALQENGQVLQSKLMIEK
ncbi:MAG: S8 family peptidase [Flavobacteriales bacterium]|nr:S8 family peptidase [Flavobacteriales bacterium]